MTSTNCVLIQYPGIIKNVEKALVTMGGIAKISQEYFNSGTLSLDYHPENVYSRPTSSRKRNGTFLIIRARRKRCEDSDAPSPLEAEVVGLAPSVIQFNVLFDFQYLPVAKEKATTSDGGPRKFVNMMPKLMPQSLEESMKWFDPDPDLAAEEIDLFLPPVCFSKFYATTPYILHRETERADKSLKNMPMGSRLRASRKSYAVLVNGGDKFPTEPPPETFKHLERWLAIPEPNAALAKAFEERPLYTRGGILYHSNIEEIYIKELLPRYAFYIISGPWGRCWCRHGYDPRLSPESRQYQSMMMSQKSQPLIPERRSVTLAQKLRRPNVNPDQEKIYSELIYSYIPGEMPPFRQMHYQLCDIELPSVKALLQKPASRTTCDLAVNGWLSVEEMESVKRALKDDMERTTDSIAARLSPEIESDG